MIVNSESVLVSILVPVYKVEKYIEKCAMSLFEQTYDNIEYVFVDDCSPDDSIALLESIMERYPKRKEQVKIVAHEKNAGLSNARITGINNCSGLY
ncbi:glycosyltransferase, partial [Escherichia coli]|nr:glycosyltransferase [Escherichia coli]